MIDSRFTNLVDDEFTEDDSQYLDTLINQIQKDLQEDEILFDEISVDSEKIIESIVGKHLKMREMNGVRITGRKMRITLEYEVFRP